MGPRDQASPPIGARYVFGLSCLVTYREGVFLYCPHDHPVNVWGGLRHCQRAVSSFLVVTLAHTCRTCQPPKFLREPFIRSGRLGRWNLRDQGLVTYSIGTLSLSSISKQARFRILNPLTRPLGRIALAGLSHWRLTCWWIQSDLSRERLQALFSKKW
jgi:hypothetical protein